MNLIEFKSEEARDTIVIRNLVEGKEYPLLGAPFSAGGRSGPAFYYLLSIPYFFVQDPRAISFFVGLLNVCGVFLLYEIGKNFFSKNVGLISSALLAVSPFAVIYSRKIWNIDALLPFALLFFFLLLSYLEKKKTRYLLLAAIPLAIAMQIHVTSIVLIFIMIFSFFVYKQKIRIKEILLFLIIFLALFSPFFYYEANHDYENIRTFINYKSKIENEQLNSIVWHHFMGTTTGIYFDFFLGSSAQSFYSQLPEFTNKAFAVEFVLILVGLIYISKKIMQKSEMKREYSIILFWMAITLLLLAFYSGGVYPHHVVIILPAVYLTAAVLLDSIISVKEKIAKIFALAILFSIIVMQIFFLQTFFSFINANGGASGDYDVSYNYKFQAVDFVVKDSNNNNFVATNYPSRNELNLEYTYLLSQSGKTPVQGKFTRYIILNTFTTKLSGEENNYLSQFPMFQFGPVTVYKESQISSSII
jgi:4-amino-4-deoxy-L-arabinose transferase-like glycosyltransferase